MAFSQLVESYLALACKPMLEWLRENTLMYPDSTLVSEYKAFAPLLELVAETFWTASAEHSNIKKTLQSRNNAVFPPIDSDDCNVANVSPRELRLWCQLNTPTVRGQLSYAKASETTLRDFMSMCSLFVYSAAWRS